MSEDEDLVVLVDEGDREVGFAPKLAAHRLGQRHRAVSVCLIDARGRMLMQRRAIRKYHSGGLWTNACCTHPRPGEDVQQTAERRLFEELGVACGIRFLFCTHYRAPVGKGLVENEIVHLFSGHYEGRVDPNPDEVEDLAWLSHDFLLADLAARPDAYSYWFNHYIREFGNLLFE